MAKITKKELIAGAAVTAALGAAAALLLAPKSGRKTRREIRLLARDFYKYAAPRVKKLKGLSLAEYEALLKRAGESYGKIKKLSAADRRALWLEARRAWVQVKKKLAK